MTGPRVLAIFLAACALAASALIALPMDDEGTTASISAPEARLDNPAARRSQLAGTAESTDEAHTGIPRLWLR